MSAGRSGDPRFDGGGLEAARSMAAAESAGTGADTGPSVAPRHPPPVQLRVAPASRGSRLARMSSRRETTAAAAPLNQRTTTVRSRGPRTSASMAPPACAEASATETGDAEVQARQWMHAHGKKQPARRPQRVRTLKLKTQVHPDALMPFLYSERGSPINMIMNETGCSIDYCAVSPDDMDDQAGTMQGRPHIMTFLVSAETTEMLEDGSRRLRMLVNRIQTHAQRRMKAQNIYERQERQSVSAAEDEARAGMFAEQQAARMDALERDTDMLDFPGRPQQASNVRSREAQAIELHRRVGSADTDLPRMVQEAYPPTAHFPTRPCVGSGVRFAYTGSGEHYREMMWTRPQSNIYYRMEEPMPFPLQRPRYPNVVDVEQQEMKSPLPPPESSGRPIKSADDSLLSTGDDGVRPYIRRRLHASLDRPRRGFVPPHPQMGSEYAEYNLERVGMRRAMKRPLRARAPPTSDQNAFTEMQRFRGSNVGEQQELADAANPPENAPSATADTSAAMPVRLEQFELDEDVDEEWVTRPAPRRYHRPMLGYYVRTPDGYMEPVAPPAGAYYYERPQAMYDDYFEYGDSIEWISDEDDGTYAYEYPQRHERFPTPELPSGAHEQRRQFVRSAPSDDYRIWSIPDRAPARLFKRQKVSYGDFREQGYQAESDSAPDERPSTVLAPRSDEEPRPQTESPPEFDSTPLVEVPSFGHEDARGDAERSARSATSISEGEENESGVCNEAHASSEQPPPPDTTTTDEPDEKPVVQGADSQDPPVDVESTSLDPGARESEPNKGQSKTGEAPVLRNASDRVEDVDAAPALPPSTGEVVSDSRQDEFDKAADSDTSVPSSTESGAPRDHATAGLQPTCSATDEPVGAESNQAEACGAVEASATNGDIPTNADSTTNETSAIVEASVAGEAGKTNNSASVPTEYRDVIVSSPRHVATPITASMTMNDRLAHSLENMNRCEADLIRVKEELTSQKERYLALEKEEYHRKRLQILLEELVSLQCRLAARDSLIFGSLKHEMLKAIQALLDSAAESDEPVAFKVEMLRKGLETIVSVQAKIANDFSPSDAVEPVNEKEKQQAQEELSDDPACVGFAHSDHEVEDDHADSMDGAASPCSPATNALPDEPSNDAVDEEELLSTQTPAVDRVVKLERDLDDFSVKQENVSLDCPRELPLFLWTFLMHSLTPDASQSSYVMRVMYNRLLEEIVKSNPYYYLHRSMLHPRRQVSASTACEFGCRGASSTKWERKLISQINSRMKSFDNAAYSLARSGGGKDVLNRKKLNSIIRKVHLVAMQVHSLLSHLYCLKGRVVCSEADAMSSALNNSHFEKRMGVYKSRLKLVFPHKQPSIGASPSKEPEDLVRDTFEFFPELLVCVDIWGYNYREALIKRQRASDTIILTADGIPTEPASGFDKNRDAPSLLPQSFFRSVEGKAFDFDNDSNGLLRCICDELLNIVCLWNDFKWMENLEALDLERIVAFENGVGSSIIKILGLYAGHLQALWAARIRAEPEYLCSVRLTQHNAYYTPRSLVSFPSSGAGTSAECSIPSSAVDASLAVPTAGATTSLQAVMDPEPVKQSESDAEEEERDAVAETTVPVAPTSEQRVAEAYWSRKFDGSINPGQCVSHGVGAARSAKLSSLIEADELVNWGESTLSSHLLHESDESALRTDLDELSTVASELLGSRGDEKRLVDVAGRYRTVSGDIVQASEKLALHLAARQMRDETKQQVSTPTTMHDAVVASEVASLASSIDEASPPRRSRRSRRREIDEEWSPPASPSSALSDQSALDVDDEDAVCADDVMIDEDEDQPVRDVIEVLAATKRQLHELTAQRARSARVREKLQVHAVDLARQALELVRNTAQMYT